jgi:urea transport system substrate-binding protein
MGGSKVNDEFVRKFKAKYGADRVTSDPIEAGYFGIYLWKQAVEDASRIKKGPVDSEDILKAIRRQSHNAPEGVVYLDPESLHTWKIIRVGKIRADGQFDVVWDSGKPIRPVPYPIYRTTEAWKRFLGDLHRGWGGKWANESDH